MKNTVSLEGLHLTLDNNPSYVLSKYVIDKSLNPQIDLLDYFEVHGIDDLTAIVWKAEHGNHLENIIDTTSSFLNGKALTSWSESHGIIMLETK